jgi:hypothetical protein
MENIINVEKLHTTPLSEARISEKLGLNIDNVLVYCKRIVYETDNEKIILKGKNWYVYGKNCILTINAKSNTIITANKIEAFANIALPRTVEELYSTYYLKDELVVICKKLNLPAVGSKESLLKNICNY